MKTGRVRFLLSFATALLALTASGACVAQVQKDREFQECPECPVMVGIPAGTFIMGSPHTDANVIAPPARRGRAGASGVLPFRF